MTPRGALLASGATIVLLLACLSPAQCAVHTYNNDFFYSVGDAYIYRGGREGMFGSKSEATDEWGNVARGVANGKSYIRFSRVEFERPLSVAQEYGTLDGDTGLVQAVVFEVNDRDRIGYSVDGVSRRYCCTKELVAKTKCFPGQLIVQPKVGDVEWPWQTKIYFIDNDTTTYAVDEAVTITETGMYYLWFVICDPNLAGVRVGGMTSWKNPMGYLPGMMAANLPFYGVMSLLYLGLGFLWFLQYLRHWRDILPLQNYITAVLALGMIEMATWYFDYVNFNTTGFRPVGNTLWAVAIGSVRKTVARMLLLVVSMGYGVVRPALGGLKSTRVVALGLLYLAATCTLDIMTNVGAIDDLTSSTRIFLVLPVAILDAVFILSIFTSLSKTLAQLQTRRQGAKLELYRRFTNMLAVAVFISIAWIVYEMYFKVTDQYNERWQSDWITNAFWHVLSFAMICIICLLWAPVTNATRYAYSDDAPEEYDEEEGQNLKSSVDAEPASKAEGKKPVNTDVFSIDDEGEGEGKME